MCWPRQGTKKHEKKKLQRRQRCGHRFGIHLCDFLCFLWLLISGPLRGSYSSCTVTFSILSPWRTAFTTFWVFSMTSPKIECLLSSQGVATWVMKNCDPLELGPELAIERTPGPLCFRSLWNSSLKE